MHKLCKNVWIYGIATLLVLVLLSSCQINSGTEETNPDDAKGKTAPVVKTEPTFKITPSQNPTKTTTPTRPATATRTASPSRTPTWTPIPTLQDEQAKNLINQLLTENANCELPCVWGIIPGQTPWFEAQRFLLSFLEVEDQGGDPSSVLRVDFRSLEAMPDIEISLSVKKYDVMYILLDPPSTAISYRVEDILSRYGEPESVYIGATTGFPVKGLLPFDMILYYPDHHFSALFEYNGEIIGNQIRVCPVAQPIGPKLTVWDIRIDRSLEELYRGIFDPSPPYLLNVEEALGMDTEQFTDKYKNKNPGNCFVTKTDLW